jgi:hypothetical protein
MKVPSVKSLEELSSMSSSKQKKVFSYVIRRANNRQRSIVEKAHKLTTPK